MAPTKRAAPPTHPTVWIGLGLAGIGLLFALYAYTGTRVYDVLYAGVALVGGVLALAGILTAAWGRAVMSARASRERRSLIQRDAVVVADAIAHEAPPPTVAEPAAKKRFSFPKASALLESSRGKASTLFAFRRRPSDEAPPSPPPASEPVAVAVAQRLTLKCPQCGQQFSAEGVRPFTATCSHCGFAAEV
jgi:hypothetical protein